MSVIHGGPIYEQSPPLPPLFVEVSILKHAQTRRPRWNVATHPRHSNHIKGELQLSSAWARRAPFLWAGIPLLAIAVVEKLVLGSTRLLDALTFRLLSGPASTTGSSDPMAHVNTAAYLRSPDLWIGLVVAALFLALAARMRRRSGLT